MADEVSPGGSLARLVNDLKNERVKRHLSIDDISRIVNISAAHIEKVEASDFSFLPPLYVFSILKKYAGELGAGDEQLLAQCRLELQMPDLPVLSRPAVREQDSGTASPETSRFPVAPSGGFIMLAVILVLAFALLLLLRH